MEIKQALATVGSLIGGMFMMALVIALIASMAHPANASTTSDYIIAQHKTVEVDCESDLASELMDHGFIVYATDDYGHCDASPKDIAIDVSHIPSPVVDALIRKGYHSSPLDGREMLYPPTTDTPDSAR